MDYDVYARTGGEKSLQSRDSRTGRENLGRAGVSVRRLVISIAR